MILGLILSLSFILLLYVTAISSKNYRMSKIRTSNRKLLYIMLKEFKEYGVYNDYINLCRFQTVDELLEWFDNFDMSEHVYMLINEPVINKSQMSNKTFIIIKRLVYSMYLFDQYGKY